MTLDHFSHQTSHQHPRHCETAKKKPWKFELNNSPDDNQVISLKCSTS